MAPNMARRTILRRRFGALARDSARQALEQTERKQIVQTIGESNWIVGGARGAAARLGLKRTSLAYKMQKLGISGPTPVTDTWHARQSSVFRQAARISQPNNPAGLTH